MSHIGRVTICHTCVTWAVVHIGSNALSFRPPDRMHYEHIYCTRIINQFCPWRTVQQAVVF